MTRMDMVTAAAHIGQKSALNKVVKLIHTHIEQAFCLAEQAKIVDATIKETMLPQFWQSTQGYISVQATSGCMHDVRLQIEGEQMIIGIDVAALHDDSLDLEITCRHRSYGTAGVAQSCKY